MAKDIIHDQVKNALIKNGWTITYDPFTLKYGGDKVFADLAAERIIAAEQNGEKIVVEIKNFTGISAIQDFKVALGQYMLYLTVLQQVLPEYKLFIGISEETYKNVFQRKMIQLVVQQHKLPLIIVNVEAEEIVKWIN